MWKLVDVSGGEPTPPEASTRSNLDQNPWPLAPEILQEQKVLGLDIQHTP